MCVVVYQPAKAHLDKERAIRLWERNPDGGGFVYTRDNELVVEKDTQFAPFWRKFETARSQCPNTDFLLHMRIATHGGITTDNIHPFFVNDKLTMMHNGMLNGIPEYDDGRSDTRVFIDEVLPELPPTWLDSPYLKSMVEEWIGYNKLVFLNTDPILSKQVYILNEGAGRWIDKMWFSNTHGVFPQPANQVTYPINKQFTPWTSQDKETPVLTIADYDWDAPPHALTELREPLGLNARVAYSAFSETWTCYGCDETVEEKTGVCQCWEKICLDCNELAVGCLCDHYSSNLIHYDDLTDKQLETFLERL